MDLHNPEGASEARREPLWRRNMPGLRHIRGILFDERDAYLYEEQMGKANSAVPPVSFCVSAAPVKTREVRIFRTRKPHKCRKWSLNL